MQDDVAGRAEERFRNALATDGRTPEQLAVDAERQFLSLVSDALAVQFDDQSAEAMTLALLLPPTK